MSETELRDLDLFGREDNLGNPIYHKEDKAISNALVFWATSKPGDFVNDPKTGGPISRLKFKQLSSFDTVDIARDIEEEIRKYFNGVLDLDFVSIVKADENPRLIIITVEYQSLISGKQNRVEFLSKVSFQDPPVQKLEINYSEENLLAFVLLQQEQQQGEKLLQNSETGLWEWGTYIFTEFTMNDSKFSEILNLINGSV